MLTAMGSKECAVSGACAQTGEIACKDARIATRRGRDAVACIHALNISVGDLRRADDIAGYRDSDGSLHVRHRQFCWSEDRAAHKSVAE